MIALTEQGKRLVGHPGQAAGHRQRRAYRVRLKRLLGRKFASQAVRQVTDMVAYRIVAGPNDEVR